MSHDCHTVESSQHCDLPICADRQAEICIRILPGPQLPQNFQEKVQQIRFVGEE